MGYRLYRVDMPPQGPLISHPGVAGFSVNEKMDQVMREGSIRAMKSYFARWVDEHVVEIEFDTYEALLDYKQRELPE